MARPLDRLQDEHWPLSTAVAEGLVRRPAGARLPDEPARRSCGASAPSPAPVPAVSAARGKARLV